MKNLYPHEYFGWDRGFEVQSEGARIYPKPIENLIYLKRALYINVTHRINQAICWKFGHKIVDESHITPDGGVEDFYCIRCGWGFHHVYY